MCVLPRKVVVRVPATTANMGPAYDSIGMALSIFAELTVEHSDAFSMSVEGEGCEEIQRDEQNMVVRACCLAFEYGNKKMPTLRFIMRSDIPYGCGCGSSSAAAVAGFVAGLQLCGHTMATGSEEELLQAIAKFEGHPDNAAPALYGGIQLCYKEHGGRVLTTRVPTPFALSVVLFIPREKMKESTHVTRGLIPDFVPLEDAVYNISCASILVLALSTGDLRTLRSCGDKIHEGQRGDALFPHFRPCVNAAKEAGAAYAFLSGAGPTVCALVGGRHGEVLTQPKEERVAERVALAMIDAACAVGVEGRVVITQPSDQGVHVVGAKSVRHNLVYVST